MINLFSILLIFTFVLNILSQNELSNSGVQKDLKKGWLSSIAGFNNFLFP